MAYNSFKDGVQLRYNNRSGCFVICEDALKWSCVDSKCIQKLDGEFLTEEESHWAGKVNGNEVEFFGWWGALIAFIYF